MQMPPADSPLAAPFFVEAPLKPAKEDRTIYFSASLLSVILLGSSALRLWMALTGH
jgi:hypothetical protein